MNLPLFRSTQRAISEVKRKELFDLLRLSDGPYHGSISEIDFFDQIYNLDEMPKSLFKGVSEVYSKAQYVSLNLRQWWAVQDLNL